MDNLVLITSVVNTPNTPLSYSKVRSVFTRNERYEQTKKTIQSIKEKIPNSKIIIVECTDFTKEEKDYFEKHCDWVLNLWNRLELHPRIFGVSKAMGEGTMTIEALKFLIKNNFKYNNLFKICGRYWLNNNFNYDKYNNNNLVFKKINENINNIFTSFYKIPYNSTSNLLKFLIENEKSMVQCIGYEVLFAKYLNHINYDNVKFIDNIGYEGNVTVCGSTYIG